MEFILFYCILFLNCVIQIYSENSCSKNKICIQKCCDVDQILRGTKCMNIADLPKPVLRHNFSDIHVYTWDEEKKSLNASVEGFNEIFELADNVGLEKCYNSLPSSYYKNIYLLKNGSLQIERPNKIWAQDKAGSFCIDYKVMKHNNTKRNVLTYKIPCDDYNPKDEIIKTRFVVTGLLISCFFMLLVLIVYYLIPSLRNLPGLILMVYLITMMICFASKATLLFVQTRIIVPDRACEIVSPLIYYVTVASFIWSTIMAVQAWKKITGTRMQSIMSRYEERVKFRRYNLIVWSVTLAIVAFALVIEYLVPYDYINPNFRKCTSPKSNYVWIAAPVAVLTLINLVFFVRTVVYTFSTNRVMTGNEGGGKVKSNRRTIRTGGYIKFSVLMSVTWLLEAVPNNIPLWLFIVVNLYNICIGIALFCVFVLNKRVIKALCKRLNIPQPFRESFRDRSLSTATKSSSVVKRETGRRSSSISP